MLVAEAVAALASDSAQHEADRTRHPRDRQKITRVNERAIVSVSGTCAVGSADGALERCYLP